MRRAKAAARRAAALLAALTLLAAPAIAAGAAEPAHVLSYTTGRLTWDSATGIDENGAAVLSLFADAYQNVLSENGERVVAPGTDGSCTVCLENRMGYAISYIAVAYRIKEAETLPVEPEFSCEGAEDTGSYPLPEGVEDAQVIRAVRGELSGGQSADFRLDWLWEYYESDARDVLDTALGDKAAFDTPDDVTAGIYIVVEEEQPDPPVPTPDPTPVHSEPPDKPDKPDASDEPEDPAETDAPDGPGDTDDTDGGYIRPEVPKTGDESAAWLYLALIFLCGAAHEPATGLRLRQICARALCRQLYPDYPAPRQQPFPGRGPDPDPGRGPKPHPGR